MTKKEIDDKYIERLQKHIETTEKAVNYSIERFDILIISLSTSGLIISIGFFKDIINEHGEVDPLLLKITWWLFASSLIMNLVSQVTGFFAHKYDLKATKHIIRNERGKKSKTNFDRVECCKKTLDNFTHSLNIGSLVGFIAGIITLIIFISKYV